MKESNSCALCLQGASQRLDKFPNTVEEFVDHLSFLGRMSTELPALEKEYNVVHKMFTIARDFNVYVHPEDLALYKTLAPSFQHLKVRFDTGQQVVGLMPGLNVWKWRACLVFFDMIWSVKCRHSQCDVGTVRYEKYMWDVGTISERWVQLVRHRYRYNHWDVGTVGEMWVQLVKHRYRYNQWDVGTIGEI